VRFLALSITVRISIDIVDVVEKIERVPGQGFPPLRWSFVSMLNPLNSITET